MHPGARKCGAMTSTPDRQMQEPASQNAQPIPAHVFQIMLSLLDGDSHGYTVIEDVAARTGGSMRLGTSTLYAVIKRLERTGWAEAQASAILSGATAAS